MSDFKKYLYFAGIVFVIIAVTALATVNIIIYFNSQDTYDEIIAGLDDLEVAPTEQPDGVDPDNEIEPTLVPSEPDVTPTTGDTKSISNNNIRVSYDGKYNAGLLDIDVLNGVTGIANQYLLSRAPVELDFDYSSSYTRYPGEAMIYLLNTNSEGEQPTGITALLKKYGDQAEVTQFDQYKYDTYFLDFADKTEDIYIVDFGTEIDFIVLFEIEDLSGSEINAILNSATLLE